MNRLSTCVALLLAIIGTNFIDVAGAVEGAKSSALDLVSLKSNPKLANDAQLLEPLENGSSTISIVVSLRDTKDAKELSAVSLRKRNSQSFAQSLGAPTSSGPYYDLTDSTIKTKLASTVKTELDSFLLGVQGFNATSVGANKSSAVAPITISNQFTYSFGFAANVTLEGLDYLLASDKVLLIEENLILKPHLTQGINVMNGTATRVTYKGAGVAVAIVDTGVDDSHPDLNGGKVLGGYDFGDDDTNFRPTSSGSAHGTSVGGIVAGDVNTVGDYIGGVASDAKLYGLKISPGDTGSASSADMIDAWEWAITHQNDDPNNPILIVNTSFGGGRYTSSCNSTNSSMTQAALNGVNAGITHFVSSGNDGYCDAMGWPACITHVNSVGAVYDANIGSPGFCVSTDSCLATSPNAGCPAGTEAAFETSTSSDKVTLYSNSDTNLTIFAPSNNAYTADIAGAGGYSSGDYTTSFGGTSAAAPYSSGAAAVLQSAAKAKMGRFLTPAEVQQYFVNNGQSITDTKAGISKPRVDIGAAVANLPTLTWDLIVESPNVSDNSVTTFQSFNIGATVRNQGTGSSEGSTLRYYRSSNSTISTADTLLATDAVTSLASGATSPETETISIATAGNYWVGACVDAVPGETSTSNQCSTGVQISVADPALSLSIVAASISEAGGSATATVSRNSETTSGLTVTLSSSDTTEATVPVSVTIAAGQSTSSAFVINAVDDLLVDGSQTVSITASTAAHNNGIDTVDVTDDDTAALTLTIAASSISESAGSTTATVSRNSNTGSALTVSLASSDATEATLPSSVTIAAGQTSSAAFAINAVDDDIVDGSQTVSITGSAAGHTSGADSLDVTDNDSAALTFIIAAASISESGGSTTATVSRNTNSASSLTVTLTSSDTSEATVPASVTIAAGQSSSAAFNINAVDDDLVDGSQTVSITASAVAHTGSVDTLDVNDDDSAALTLAIVGAAISEAGGSTTATVSRNTNTGSALSVSLSSNDTSEATVPVSVTIAAGQLVSSAFSITAVDDAAVDGNQTVSITASAAAHANSVDTLQVTDDDDAELNLSVVALSISESGGTSAATVSRNTDTGSSLTVTLTSNDTSEVTVPASVTIDAGQSISPTFSVVAVDDSEVDGTQTVTITASAAAHTNSLDNVDVTDDDAATLSLSIVDASISEAGGSSSASVTRNTDTGLALSVSALSSDTSEATVPSSITIAAGQSTSPSFTINVVDDDIVDGTQNVTIIMTAAGHTDGIDMIDVTDDDVAEITMTIEAASINEGDGPAATFATVSRNTDTGSALIVALSSSDTTEVLVPAGSVSIIAGQSASAAFNIEAVEDSEIDGTQTVTVTASAAAHADGTDSVDVVDNDTPSLGIVIVADSVSENDGPGATTATVSRNTDPTAELTVFLASDDPAEATVQASINIAAGETTSAPFNIDAIADAVVDGTQTVTITASAAAHSDGSDTLDVIDATEPPQNNETSPYVVPLPNGGAVIIDL